MAVDVRRLANLIPRDNPAVLKKYLSYFGAVPARLAERGGAAPILDLNEALR